MALRWEVERANTPSADGVSADVEVSAKAKCLVAVQDRQQRAVMDVADRPVEKARAHGPVRLDHRRNPGRIATGRLRRDLADVGAEVPYDPTQLGRALGNKPCRNVLLVPVN